MSKRGWMCKDSRITVGFGRKNTFDLFMVPKRPMHRPNRRV